LEGRQWPPNDNRQTPPNDNRQTPPNELKKDDHEVVFLKVVVGGSWRSSFGGVWRFSKLKALTEGKIMHCAHGVNSVICVSSSCPS
jgi:hypothetical protein